MHIRNSGQMKETEKKLDKNIRPYTIKLILNLINPI